MASEEGDGFLSMVGVAEAENSPAGQLGPARSLTLGQFAGVPDGQPGVHLCPSPVFAYVSLSTPSPWFEWPACMLSGWHSRKLSRGLLDGGSILRNISQKKEIK